MAGLIFGYFHRSETYIIFIISSIIASILFYILAKRLAIENSKRWEKTKESLYMEREKLRTHLQFSTRGRAVFSPYRKETSSNELFIQLLNMISDEKVKYSEFIFELPEIKEPYGNFYLLNQKELAYLILFYQFDLSFELPHFHLLVYTIRRNK